ncbi:MAG: DEAD/DEAH box helicase [Candidatus Pacebacteria bacterium]|nr:DEAD/DEAH box helicase [Candidatus Paceibacterota bacterium]
MPSLEDMRQALHAEVGAGIYARGLGYFKRGHVIRFRIGAETDTLLRINGTVRGGDTYHTSVAYSREAGTYLKLSCTCPYRYGCKHTVALVLAYVDSVAHSQGVPNTKIVAEVSMEGDVLKHQIGKRSDLPQGYGVTYPERSETSMRAGDTLGQAMTPVSPDFDRSAYVVMLHRHRRYAASLHHKDRYYEQVNIQELLARKSMTDDDRTLFTYIHNHNGFAHTQYGASPSDPTILFPLLSHAGLGIVCNESYYTYDPRPVTLDLAPPPIRVELVHERFPHLGDTARVRHEIMLVLTDERPPGRGVGRSIWSRFGTYLLHEKDTKLRLYELDSVWAELLKEVLPKYREDFRSLGEYLYHGVSLSPKILDRFSAFLTMVPSQIELRVSEPVRSLVVHPKYTARVFEIELDSGEHTLQVTPHLRYDGWSCAVADAVVRRFHGRSTYVLREHYEIPTTHVLREDGDGVLHYIKRNAKEEIAFYKEIEAHREEVGFTKMLKCHLRGKGKVMRYIAEVWPKVRMFVEGRGYEVIFTHDALPKESVSFRADFTSPDVDADRNWLHFDVDLYCAGEKVTLEKLYDYMSSGSTFWRKEDGSLVEVENREELERLVRLLQSFRARQDGGFEGGLHHAPELSYVLTSSPHYTAAQSKSLKSFMKRVEAGRPVKRVSLPKKVRDVLRPYQKQGVEWLYFLRSYRFAGILADDMGLGKTVQALTVLALEKIEGVPSIVVCPKSLLYNWKKEAATFFPDLHVLVYEGAPAERERLQIDLAAHDLIVVGYATLKRDADVLCAPHRRYNYAVLDEAQYIKNHMTKMAQCVKEIPADYRLALTGTPLENHVFELWSIYDYLMPGFLGRRDHFAEQYHKPIMEGNDRNALMHLRKKIECFMLRRTKEEVLAELPPKIEQVVECVLTDAQNIVYQQILGDVRGTVFSAVDARGFRGSQIHILAGLTKLRQACNHPALLTKEEDYTAYESAKLDACMELIEEVRQGGRKVLVFSQFTGMLDILAHALTAQDVGYTYLSGKTQRREQVIERFNTDPAVTAFLISMKAGGTGLNLTAADTVIVFDPWWNPSVENQAIDRAHRIGQTKSVNVYRLLTKGTIEEKIQDLKRKKKGLFDAVVEESGGLMEKLTWEDIRELFIE